MGFEGRALGSALRLHVRLPDDEAGSVGREAAGHAWAVVRAEFDATDLALSRFRDDSELTALNCLAGSGRIVAVSWRLRTLLAAAHRARRLTDGRFEAAVVEDLERIGERGALQAPEPKAAVGLAPSTGPGERVVRLLPEGAPGTSLVRAPAAPIDSGGIGKGLALRWAAAAAMRVLATGGGLLLDAGGDIASAGVAPADGWRVGIEDPIAPGPGADPLAVVAVERGAVATSSVRVRNWVGPDGRRVHHLLDPRSGQPAHTGLIAVTVAGMDPAWSEVWTKALFLSGRDSIGEEARSRGLAAWWVDDAGRLGMTPEARLCSVWVADARMG